MKKILSFLVAICSVLTIYAQTTKGRITGSVVDGSQKTIESATIALLRAKDSANVKFSVADKSGYYVFDGVQAGKYLVAISAVGHQKTFSEIFEVSDASSDIKLKTIELVPQEKAMGTVTVTAKRPLIEQKIDRTIVNVEASITNVGNSALEVLEKSPGIMVDKDGNVSLKGKSSVTIMIDGRETHLEGIDLANYLRNMQASQMDQIEIMTNPPAKYDATGNSGIINIKTKKNKQLGYNGSANVGYSQGIYPRYNGGLNLNYRKNKVNFFTNGNYNYNFNYGKLTIQRNFRDKDTKELLSHFDQQAENRNLSKSINGKIGMDYFAAKNTTLGFVVSGFENDRDGASTNVTNITNSSGALINQTRATNNSDQQWKNLSTNLNFRQVLDSTGSELTADFDFSGYNSKYAQKLINSYYDGAGLPIAKADSLLGSLPQNIRIYSGRVDYFKNLKGGARFDAGLKTSFVRTDNDASYDSVINGDLVHDYNRSNHFIYQENINAAYVNLNKPLNKKWGAQLGLRLENTNAQGNQVTTGERFDRHYTQLFPTAYVQYKQDKNNTWVLNYGRRIRRPDYQSLNPFINFIDRYTYSQGNPNLKPQFSHNIELSHSYMSYVTTTFNYTSTTDIIQNVLEQNEAKNETFMRRVNIASQRQYGLSVNTNVPLTKWWRSNVYANVFNNKFDGIANNTHVTIAATTFMLNGTQQFNFAKTWSAELGGFFRTGGIEGVIVTKPMGMVSLGFAKQIMKNNGSLRLNIRDLFNTQKFQGSSKYANIDAAFQEKGDTRVINLGFSYRFTKGKLNATPKKRSGSANEEQGRVGAGG